MDNADAGRRGAINRRRLIQATAGLAAGAAVDRSWLARATRNASRRSTAAVDTPSKFPAGIDLARVHWENWALNNRADDVLVATPRSADDVVRVANWAIAHGWRVRPNGAQHGWSPFTVRDGQSASDKVLLVDLKPHVNRIAVDARRGEARVEAGATLDAILAALEAHGFGWTSVPATGGPTLGGALAINAHGAALPAVGEAVGEKGFGSLSNRVLSLTAVVWDQTRFVLRTFERSEPITKALLTSLGRVFVTSATLRAERNVRVRCVSHTDIGADELFAPAGYRGRTFESFLAETGRVEAICFPFTHRPWLKVWSETPRRPDASRQVDAPYNYAFSDRVPLPLARLAASLVVDEPEATPYFGNTMLGVATDGLRASRTSDIWGWSKNTQLYIRASTLRVVESGACIVVARRDVQTVLHDVWEQYQTMVRAYRARGEYPMNMPLELRCNALDDPSFLSMTGAEAPTLSALVPRHDHPEWDTAVWVNALFFTGTRGAQEFCQEFEQWIRRRFVAPFGAARVEWSKGWAYTGRAAWAEPTVLRGAIPDDFRAGRATNANWDWSVAQFNAVDPHRVFGNDLLDRLL